MSDALAFNWLGLRPGARLAEALGFFGIVAVGIMTVGFVFNLVF